MPNAGRVEITPEHLEQFRKEGFFVLERAIPPAHLENLRSECARFVAEADAELERKNAEVTGPTHKGKRYFIEKRYTQSEKLREFLFSPLMAQICRATLGETAYLFYEQYVVKAAEVGMKFGWHQDSAYVGHAHRPYLTCWCALDDMSVENGTVYMLPNSRSGAQQLVAHSREAGTNDLIGYHGDDPGDPVRVPAGSIAVFSSLTLHRSGTNTTPRMRRVYVAQYSPEIIQNKAGTAPHDLAVPFLAKGLVVSEQSVAVD